MITTNLNTQISTTPSLLSIQEYEQNITENPQEVTNYWYLGLALLLAGREEEAQIAWMTPMLEFGEEESEQWLLQLTEILFNAAQQQETDSQSQLAWVIRQHIREFVPGHINNLLKIIELNIDLKIEDWETTINQLIAIISELIQPPIFDEKLLVLVIEKLLRPNPVNPPAFIDKLVEAFTPYLINSETIIQLLIDKADAYSHFFDYQMSLYFAKIAYHLRPNNLACLSKIISPLQSLAGSYNKDSIDWANKYLEIAQEPIDKILGTHFLLTGFLKSLDDPEKAVQIYQEYKQLLSDLVNNQTESKSLIDILAIGAFFLYMEDNPHENRLIRNGLAALCQKMIWKEYSQEINIYQQRLNTPRPALSERPLRIGYISECFISHSVGYLAWWLLKYHNRQEFDIHLYSLRERIYDPQQQAYKNEFGDHFHQLCPPIVTVADKINEDEIDILVDLDSLTSYSNCAILALKPAPIQVSWLGYDATGFPT
ncbi:MAG: hypothetical protein ACKOQS_29580, partial [Dolichospermum sp.]